MRSVNKFNLLRYLSKWKYLIFIVCVLGALLVYRYAMSNQEYTASTVIRYTNQDASRGKTPSGDDIDVTEIYSATVITNVLEDRDGLYSVLLGGQRIQPEFRTYRA